MIEPDDALPQIIYAPIRTAYRMCIRRGLTFDECCELIPRAHGLKGKYTPKQLAELLWLREMDRTGKFKP